MQTCAETHMNRTREQVLSVQGSWRTNLEQVLGRACVFVLHGGSQSLMQGRAEQTCGKWRKQNVVAPPRSSAGRPTSWLWSLPRGQLPCDLSFVERLRFDGNPKPNTYENQHCPSGRFGSQMTPRFNLLRHCLRECVCVRGRLSARLSCVTRALSGPPLGIGCG